MFFSTQSARWWLWCREEHPLRQSFISLFLKRICKKQHDRKQLSSRFLLYVAFPSFQLKRNWSQSHENIWSAKVLFAVQSEGLEDVARPAVSLPLCWATKTVSKLPCDYNRGEMLKASTTLIKHKNRPFKPKHEIPSGLCTHQSSF